MCGVGANPNCDTIEHAVNVRAASGDTVLVQPGTYSTASATAIALKDRVSIRGASGNPADVIVTAQGNNNVFESFGPLSGSTISSLTIRPGAATPAATSNFGIAIDSLFDFDVVDVVIENNRFIGGEVAIQMFDNDDTSNSFHAANVSPTIRSNLFTGQFSDAIAFGRDGSDPLSGALQIFAPDIVSNDLVNTAVNAGGVHFTCEAGCEGLFAPSIRSNFIEARNDDPIEFQLNDISNTAASPYFDFSPLLDDNTIITESGFGIYMSWDSNTENASDALIFYRPTITGNTVTGASGSGGGIVVTQESFDSEAVSMLYIADVLVSGNTVTGTGQEGIIVQITEFTNLNAPAMDVQVTVSKNTVSSNSDRGIAVEFGHFHTATDADIAFEAIVTENIVTSNGLTGIEIALTSIEDITIGRLDLRATIADNTVTGNGTGEDDDGIRLRIEDWEDIATDTGSSPDGGLAPVIALIADNTVTGNSGAGIVAEAIDLDNDVNGFRFAPTITGNMVSGNLGTASGIDLRFSDEAANGTALITSNTVTANLGTGVLIQLQDNCSDCEGFPSGPIAVALRNNTITSGAGDAVRIDAADGSTSGGVLTSITASATNYEIDFGGGFFNGGSDGKNILQGFSAGTTGDCNGGAFCDIVNHGPSDISAVCNEFTAATPAAEEDFLIDDTDASDLGDVSPISVCSVTAPPPPVSFDVSTAGSDTPGCGTGGTPCASIGHALSLASAGDTILVMPGSYSTANVGLVDGVSIQGSTGDPADVTVNGGGFNVFEAFGPLSSSTVISGLTIAPGGSCSTATVTSFCSTQNGVLIDSLSAFDVVSAVFEDNRFDGGCCGIVAFNDDVASNAVHLSPTIRSNLFASQLGDGVYFRSARSGALQTVAPLISANTFTTPFSDAIHFSGSSSAEGTVAPLIHDNEINSAGLDGILLNAFDLFHTSQRAVLAHQPLITENTITGVTFGDGILDVVSSVNTSARNAIVFMQPTIVGNTVGGSGALGLSSDGIAVTVSDIGDGAEEVSSMLIFADVQIRENVVTDMGNDGIHVGFDDIENLSYGGVFVQATISDNSMIEDNGSDGVDFQVTSLTDSLTYLHLGVDLTIANNTISGNDEIGIEVQANTWSEMDNAHVALLANISGNTVDANGDSNNDHGIRFIASFWQDVATTSSDTTGGLAPILLNIDGNTVTNNSGAGIVTEALFIEDAPSFELAPTITANLISGNMSPNSGLEIRLSGSHAAGTAIVTRNTITGNIGTGVLIDLVGDEDAAGDLVRVALRSNTVTGNTGDAVLVDAVGVTTNFFSTITATNYEIDLGGGFYNSGSDGRNVFQGLTVGTTAGQCAGGAFCDVNNLGPNDVSAVCNEFTSVDVNPDCVSGTEEDFLNDSGDSGTLGNVCDISACVVECVVDADCDDGLACNGSETCPGVGTLGADPQGCLAGTPVDCDDGASCTFDACAEPSGTCSNIANDALCDDSIDCTANTCDPIDIGADADGCVFAPDDAPCDDTVPCTDDVCNPALGPGTGCQNTTNDGNCDDSINCTLDVCDAVTNCSNNPDNSLCDDSIGCTGDVCTALAPGSGCTNTPDNAPCDDSIGCTDDVCTAAAPGTGCDNTPNNATCDDSIDCTDDVCTAAAPGTGCDNTPNNAICNDSIGCTVDVCTATGPGTGCDNTPDNAPCDDSIDCTVDVCTAAGPGTGCDNNPDNAACDDSIDCTIDACTAAGPGTGCDNTTDDAVCDDLVDCTDDACDPSLGPGTGCRNDTNDGNCDDSNVCTDETCDATLDCQTTFNTDPCDDGFSCTETDTCDGAGTCEGSPNDVVCDDASICTDDACDPAAIGADAAGCISVEVDADNDAVCDAIEDGAPNNGDGNDDGVDDAMQEHVTSLPNAADGTYITMVTDPSCPHTNVQALPLDIPGVLTPFGGLDFDLIDCPTTKVTIFYHAVDNLVGYDYYKIGPNPPGAANSVTYTLEVGAPHNTMFGSAALPFDPFVGMVMFQLTDGVVGDDTVTDGDIFDLGGPGLVVVVNPAPAPTLSYLGIVIALLLMAAIARLSLRRRRV